jgi:hypothetical protein
VRQAARGERDLLVKGKQRKEPCENRSRFESGARDGLQLQLTAAKRREKHKNTKTKENRRRTNTDLAVLHGFKKKSFIKNL